MSKTLARDEALLFKSALEQYEAKKYKESLRDLDTLLKRRPQHGESLTLKGLVLHHLKEPEEAAKFIQDGLKNDTGSAVGWHIAGIYYKLRKEYAEAYKAYVQSYKIEQENPNVLQDLSMLAMHERSFVILEDVRRKFLSHRPSLDLAWLGLAIAQHLNRHYAAAEKTIQLYESLAATQKPAADTKQKVMTRKIDQSELFLYKNQIIYESGDVKRALEDLDAIEPKVLDKLAWQEQRARYLAELGRKEEALKEYRSLIHRNPGDLDYYLSFEKLCGATTIAQLKTLYAKFAELYPKAEVPKARPLAFLEGAELQLYLASYIEEHVARGIPNTFALIKDLYNDHADVVTSSIGDVQVPTEPQQFVMWLLFLSQHYSRIGKHDQALKTINEALAHTPTVLELYIAKGKILNRVGNYAEAASVLEEASNLDKGDRFLNTRAAKYAMFANKLDKAVELASIFPLAGGHTKDGMKYMRELEAVNFLTRLSRAYHRAQDHGPALKYALAVVTAIKQYEKDQYDFHYYGPRRGTARAYLQLVDWEDHLFDHPRYEEAVEVAIAEYIALATGEDDGVSSEEKAKLKKTRALLAKKMAETVPEPPKDGEPPEEPDTDPFGAALLETKDPLGEAFKLWEPLSKAKPTSSNTWVLGFGIYLAQKKYVLAVQMIKKAREYGASDSWVASAAVLARHVLENDESAPQAIRTLQLKVLPTVAIQGNISESDLVTYTDEYVKNDLLWAKTRLRLGKPQGVEARLAERTTENVEKAHDSYLLVKKYGLGNDLAEAIKKNWPQASFIE